MVMKLMDAQRSLLPLPILLFAFAALSGCFGGSEETGEACAESNLVAQCPAGTSVVLDAQAASACSGSVDASSGVVDVNGSAVGQCHGTGSCQVFCEFQIPCACGVARLSRDEVVCAECQPQSCGDGRCDGTERADCSDAAGPCFACPEDCSGATCGDGDCTADELPETCPQDCARACVPNEVVCAGTVLRLCAADGSAFTETDCALAGLLCAGGRCVAPNICGNDVCEDTENEATCPQDCATPCEPNTSRCDGEVLVRCAPNGRDETRTSCAESGLICASWGECAPPNSCGNGRCEAGEDAATCAADCEIVCGNGRCETGENATCPRDCVACGNGRCEAEEQATCPQDCGVCTPNSRTCLGATLTVCAANGQSSREVDCRASEQTCARGECVTPGLCGNGACEGNEFESCPADCVEVCGNDACGPGESFTTCAQDCDPYCGDGSCNAAETADVCALDCLASCGNGTCEPAEDRLTCSADCGYCGDGTCQDGYETAADRPINGLEPCRIDCVILTCGSDDDCDDAIDCTVNRCLNGVCAYQPDNARCAADERCLERAGCCVDQDNDTFTDVACGGSDCNDDNFAIRPGAFEVCGGGDVNCNGLHRPAVSPTIRQLTTNLTNKSGLHVVQDNGLYLLTWFAKPGGTAAIEYAMMNLDGTFAVAPTVLTREHVSGCEYGGPCRGDAIYDPVNARFALGWVDRFGPAPLGQLLWIDRAGASTPASPIQLHDANPIYRYSYCAQFCRSSAIDVPTFHQVGLFGGRTLFFAPSVTVTSFVSLVSANGDVTTPPMGVAADQVFIEDTRVVFLGSSSVYQSNNGGNHSDATNYTTDENWTLSAQNEDGDVLFTNPVQAEHLSHSSAVGWNGEALFTVSRGTGGLVYERFLVSGERIAMGPVTDRDVTILDGDYRAADGVMAVLASSQGSLYLLIQNDDGSSALPIGQIATGTEIADAQLLWTGRGYQVFWTALVDGLHQVFSTDVTCE